MFVVFVVGLVFVFLVVKFDWFVCSVYYFFGMVE